MPLLEVRVRELDGDQADVARVRGQHGSQGYRCIGLHVVDRLVKTHVLRPPVGPPDQLSTERHLFGWHACGRVRGDAIEKDILWAAPLEVIVVFGSLGS